MFEIKIIKITNVAIINRDKSEKQTLNTDSILLFHRHFLIKNGNNKTFTKYKSFFGHNEFTWSMKDIAVFCFMKIINSFNSVFPVFLLKNIMYYTLKLVCET